MKIAIQFDYQANLSCMRQDKLQYDHLNIMDF